MNGYRSSQYIIVNAGNILTYSNVFMPAISAAHRLIIGESLLSEATVGYITSLLNNNLKLFKHYTPAFSNLDPR